MQKPPAEKLLVVFCTIDIFGGRLKLLLTSSQRQETVLGVQQIALPDADLIFNFTLQWPLWVALLLLHTENLVQIPRAKQKFCQRKLLQEDF
jgi:hypothetical protein